MFIKNFDFLSLKDYELLQKSQKLQITTLFKYKIGIYIYIKLMFGFSQYLLENHKFLDKNKNIYDPKIILNRFLYKIMSSFKNKHTKFYNWTKSNLFFHNSFVENSKFLRQNCGKSHFLRKDRKF